MSQQPPTDVRSASPGDEAQKKSSTEPEPDGELNLLRRVFMPGNFHWETGLCILVGSAVLLAILWTLAADDRSQQIIYVYFVTVITVPLLVVWWLLFSGTRWLSRLSGVVAVAMVVAALFGMVRLEGFTGDFIPIFSYRWSDTAEAVAAEYFESQPELSTLVDDGTSSFIPVVTEGDWPQYRGPTRTSEVRGVTIRRDWSSQPPEMLWKHPVGPAWSSFAVIGQLAFTQEQRGEEEIVVCYELETGKQIWVHADKVRYDHPMGGVGPRATPTVYGGRLYALGATGILNCLEPRTGQPFWTRNIVEDAGSSALQFGISTSPFIHENLVIVNAGGAEGRGVAAYDCQTGKPVWAHGKRKAGYASPVLATFDGVQQLLIFGANGLAGHDAKSGEELWWFPWENGTKNNCADPIMLDNGTIFLSTGYGKGSALLDVTRSDDNWSAAPIEWKTSRRMKLKISCGLLKDGFVYGMDENILACFDPTTGKRMWKRGRFGYGQVLLIDDVILITSEDGEVVLVEASPERFRKLGSFQAIQGKVWNHPALCRGLLLVRSDTEAACFDLRPKTETAATD